MPALMFGTIKNKLGETLDYTFHEGSANCRDLVDSSDTGSPETKTDRLWSP